MKDTTVERPRRFYKQVAVAETAGGYQVTLDGRVTKTPAKADLVLPTHALAQAVAEEWDAQDERIDLDHMHLTRLANVAIDRTPGARDELAQHIAGYAETDLTCHLAEDEPELKARQEDVFAPLRQWAGDTLGVSLRPAAGIIATPQPPQSIAAAQKTAAALDDFRLTGVGHGVGLFGSVVLAFALAHQRVTGVEAFAAFRIDELWQEERWGVDAEAAARTERPQRRSRRVGPMVFRACIPVGRNLAPRRFVVLSIFNIKLSAGHSTMGRFFCTVDFGSRSHKNSDAQGCRRRRRSERDDADGTFDDLHLHLSMGDLKRSMSGLWCSHDDHKPSDWKQYLWLLLIPVIALIGALEEGDVTVAQLVGGAESAATVAAKFSLAGPVADLMASSLNIGFGQAYGLIIAAVVVNVMVVALALAAMRPRQRMI